MGGERRKMSDETKPIPKKPMQKAEEVPGKNAALGREIQAKIGQQLRAMYDNVVEEGVPDRFTDLLRQIDNPTGEDKK
jgi:hypothetical protein